jgi:hypothetical protein
MRVRRSSGEGKGRKVGEDLTARAYNFPGDLSLRQGSWDSLSIG